MRAYLVCILDSDNYREPTFLFFKNISDAHEHIKNLILSEMKNSKLWSTKTIMWIIRMALTIRF